jgi:hypothetical protein
MAVRVRKGHGGTSSLHPTLRKGAKDGAPELLCLGWKWKGGPPVYPRVLGWLGVGRWVSVDLAYTSVWRRHGDEYRVIESRIVQRRLNDS